jgi:hypothetical protein
MGSSSEVMTTTVMAAAAAAAAARRLQLAAGIPAVSTPGQHSHHHLNTFQPVASLDGGFQQLHDRRDSHPWCTLEGLQPAVVNLLPQQDCSLCGAVGSSSSVVCSACHEARVQHAAAAHHQREHQHRVQQQRQGQAVLEQQHQLVLEQQLRCVEARVRQLQDTAAASARADCQLQQQMREQVRSWHAQQQQQEEDAAGVDAVASEDTAPCSCDWHAEPSCCCCCCCCCWCAAGSVAGGCTSASCESRHMLQRVPSPACHHAGAAGRSAAAAAAAQHLWGSSAWTCS